MKAKRIINIVCDYYQFQPDEITVYIDRAPRRIECRYVCYYFLHTIEGMGWTAISRLFTGFKSGNPGHDTVIHGVQVIRNRMDVYPSFVENIAELKNIIMDNIVNYDECTTIFQENDFY